MTEEIKHIDRFRHFSMYIDPGEYAFLYDELPTTLEGISKIVHTQLTVGACPPFKSLPDEGVQPTLDRIAELMAAPDENWDGLKQYYDMIDVPTEPR